MRRQTAWLFLAIFSAIFILYRIFAGGDTGISSPPLAERGAIDLSGWSLLRDGPIELKGEWEFYWHALLTPEELQRGTVPPAYMTLPASWKGRIDPEAGNALTADGYATYRLHVRLHDTPGLLALRTNSIATAYRLWVNGVPLGGLGRVGTSKADSKPQAAASVTTFYVERDTLDIVFQVSNFDHRRGGLWESVELGTPDSLQSRHERNQAFDLMMFGSLFMMGIYQLGLFTFRRKDRSTLYFGVFCLLCALRTLLVGEQFIYRLFPEFDWETRIRLEYVDMFIAFPVFAFFMRELFPKELPRLAIKAFCAIAAVYTGVTLLTEASIFTEWMPSYQAILIASSVYLLAMVVLAAMRRRSGAQLAAAGGLIYMMTVFNDVLYFDGFIHTGSYSSAGLFAFVALYSILLSIKFVRALTAEEKLSRRLASNADHVRELNERLKHLNRSLEAAVAERTQELRLSNEHLARKHAELMKMDSARRQLLSNISHELRTPLTSIRGYAEALLDQVIVKPEEQRHYLLLMLNRMIGLNRLISDLFELSKLESGRPDLDFRSMPVGLLLERIRDKYESDVKRSGLEFEWNALSLSELAPSVCVVLDPERIDQVIENLVTNAVRCTEIGGRIALRFRVQTGNRGGEPVRELAVQVEDTGPGIADQDIPFLFERFYRGKAATAGGSGLGLAIAKEIVTHHGGLIWAESTLGQGSTFGFTLLLYDEEEQGKSMPLRSS